MAVAASGALAFSEISTEFGGTSELALGAALADAGVQRCSYELKKINLKAARKPTGERIGYAILSMRGDAAVAKAMSLDGRVLRLPNETEFIARVRVASRPSSNSLAVVAGDDRSEDQRGKARKLLKLNWVLETE